MKLFTGGNDDLRVPVTASTYNSPILIISYNVSYITLKTYLDVIYWYPMTYTSTGVPYNDYK